MQQQVQLIEFNIQGGLIIWLVKKQEGKFEGQFVEQFGELREELNEGLKEQEDNDLLVFPGERKSKNYKVIYRKGRRV